METETRRSGVLSLFGLVLSPIRSSDGAFDSRNGILDLLAINDVDDVEVEYRESVYTPSVSPALLHSVSNLNTTVDVRGPLTTARGLFIATSDRQDAQGTMGLYFAEGGSSDKVLGLTCHHVLFKTNQYTNDPYVFAGAGAPRKNVQLLGFRRFELTTSSCVSVATVSWLRFTRIRSRS